MFFFWYNNNGSWCLLACPSLSDIWATWKLRLRQRMKAALFRFYLKLMSRLAWRFDTCWNLKLRNEYFWAGLGQFMVFSEASGEKNNGPKGIRKKYNFVWNRLPSWTKPDIEGFFQRFRENYENHIEKTKTREKRFLFWRWFEKPAENAPVLVLFRGIYSEMVMNILIIKRKKFNSIIVFD